MTAGPIARGNLSVMIIATQERLRTDREPVTGDQLVGLLLTRSRVSGNGADAELADRVAADLVERFPNNARAQLAQARVDNMFHRFERALTRLHQADAGGVPTSEVLEERASVLQAQGRTHEALALWTAIRTDHPDSHSAGRLASAYAASGDWVTARALLAEAIAAYTQVSPIPLANLYADWGRLAEHAAQRGTAEAAYQQAQRLLPGHATARAGLARLST
jgi:tetratricopeptide (TPR) repeat protein